MPSQLVNERTTERSVGTHTSPTTTNSGTPTISATATLSPPLSLSGAAAATGNGWLPSDEDGLLLLLDARR